MCRLRSGTPAWSRPDGGMDGDVEVGRAEWMEKVRSYSKEASSQDFKQGMSDPLLWTLRSGV